MFKYIVIVLNENEYKTGKDCLVFSVNKKCKENSSYGKWNISVNGVYFIGGSAFIKNVSIIPVMEKCILV